MIAGFAKSTARLFVNRKIIKEEDEEIYIYGVELLYSSVFNILLAAVIAAAADTIFPTLLFLLGFGILRQYIGGYHAETHLGCMAILTGVLMTFVFLIKTVPESFEMPMVIVSNCMTMLLVLLFAPVEHPNKMLSDGDRIRLRRRGIISAGAGIILIFLFMILDLTRRYGVSAALGMLTASVAMVCEKTKDRRGSL